MVAAATGGEVVTSNQPKQGILSLSKDVSTPACTAVGGRPSTSATYVDQLTPLSASPYTT